MHKSFLTCDKKREEGDKEDNDDEKNDENDNDCFVALWAEKSRYRNEYVDLHGRPRREAPSPPPPYPQNKKKRRKG
jgi:hypothetical protein